MRMIVTRLIPAVIAGFVLACFVSASPDAFGQADASAGKAATSAMIYKQEPRRKLTVFYPDDWKSGDRRPALIILRCHIPVQREHFRKLGMVVIEPQLADVNHGRLPGSSLEEIATMPRPRHQVEDAKSAIRFIRANAEKLGVDIRKIVATGTSGGGDLALQTHLNSAFADPQDDLKISPRPDALVLYCPAFDGIDIWFVKSAAIIERAKVEAPSFLPLLDQFVINPNDEYATPLNHRTELIKLAESLGNQKGIAETEIRNFQSILELFNKSDWQLLHPVKDALRMSASRILTEEPLPPTLIMFGDRDHLYKHQIAFVNVAKERGQTFDLRIFEGGGHSFMMQPLFLEPSNHEVEKFLQTWKFLPVTGSAATP